MNTAWLMLAIFSAALTLFHLADVSKFFSIEISARILIFITLLFGIAREAYTQRGIFHQQRSQINKRNIQRESLAIRIFITTPLLYSFLMDRLFTGWPANLFNFDYIVFLPVLLLVTPAYVRWVQTLLPQPDNEYLRFGQAIMRERPWLWEEQKPILLSWAVKVFFIPLMYSWLILAVEGLLRFEWHLEPGSFIIGLFSFGLCIDLLLASGGYLFSSRIFGNEIKSTDSTWIGWLACIICYPPFLTIFHAIKQQSDSLIWSDWLHPHQPLYWVWAFLITISWLIYWLSTVSFGLRFSNLSWRGLVAEGPYRYTKHPAYLAKNIYWWLHTVPFIGINDGIDLLRNLLGLIFVSLVYYLRAKTEERHLLIFPEYAAYARHIEKNGALAYCKKIFSRRIA